MPSAPAASHSRAASSGSGSSVRPCLPDGGDVIDVDVQPLGRHCSRLREPINFARSYFPNERPVIERDGGTRRPCSLAACGGGSAGAGASGQYGARRGGELHEGRGRQQSHRDGQPVGHGRPGPRDARASHPTTSAGSRSCRPISATTTIGFSSDVPDGSEARRAMQVQIRRQACTWDVPFNGDSDGGRELDHQPGGSRRGRQSRQALRSVGQRTPPPPAAPDFGGNFAPPAAVILLA